MRTLLLVLVLVVFAGCSGNWGAPGGDLTFNMQRADGTKVSYTCNKDMNIQSLSFNPDTGAITALGVTSNGSTLGGLQGQFAQVSSNNTVQILNQFEQFVLQAAPFITKGGGALATSPTTGGIIVTPAPAK
jgi:hypothetical protein